MRLIPFIATLVALSACNYYDRKPGTETGGPGERQPVERRPEDRTVETAVVRYGELRERIFAPLCIECHNPRTLKGDLDLSTREAALAAVVAGRPDESPLFLRTSADEMPPRRRIPPLRHLSAEEKALVRSWIEGGTPE